MAGGKGLSVGDIKGKIDGEDRGKQDDAQKAATSPETQAIGKAKSIKGVGTRRSIPDVAAEWGVVIKILPISLP